MLAKLICGECVFIDDGSVGAFCVLSETLGNAELSEMVEAFVDGSEELSVSNCLSRLKHKMQNGV
jgi:hypothetical protein